MYAIDELVGSLREHNWFAVTVLHTLEITGVSDA
jgi:hypothetical protein